MSGLGKQSAVMATISVALIMIPAIAKAGGVTYTVERFDLDDVMGMTMSVTQTELGGTLCRRRPAQ